MKGCSRDGERRLGERRRWRIEKLKQLWVTKWNVKDGVCVCDTAVCERWRVWKLCVKESVWQSCVWKMVCDKVVCERWCGERWSVCDKVVCEGWCGERWCVTKWCVKDGVLKDGVGESPVWKRACDKVVCERRCVAKCCVKEGVSKTVGDNVVCERWCVKDGGWQSWVWKMVCERWCVTKWCVKEGVSKLVPRLPRKTTVDVSLCHACHVKRRWMSPSATPATQSGAAPRATNPDQARHTVPWVSRLPRKTMVDVSLCHVCHVKRRWMSPSATPATQSDAAPRATNPDQARHTVPWVPRLPRKTTVDVSLCHVCHVKRRWLSPSATLATQSDAAPRATNPDQARHTVPWVPRLPHKTTVDVSLCHACHMKRRWMSPSATPATQSGAAPRATNPDQARHTVPWVPRLPRKTTVDVSLCHVCHVKRRWMSPSATPATQSDAAPRATNPDQARHTVPWVPRLPHKTTVDVSLCHACHMKRRWMSPSATPATQSGAAPRATNPDQARHTVPWVPRLPRKTTVDVSLCHACHVKRRWMSPSATPATQSGAAPRATNPDQARHPVPSVPRLPRKTKVDVRLCHACHVKRRWMSGCATPATQSGAAPRATNPDQARHTVPWVPRLPHKTTVDVSLCHACHMKRRCGQSVCGQSVWWQSVCGQSVWWQSVCGQSVCGQSVWWQSVCGQSVWWQSVCGQSVCGQSVWWQSVCGQSVCGQSVWWQSVCWQSVCWQCVVTKCVVTKCVWTKCVLTMCGDKVCGDKVCVDKCVVTKCGGGRRRRRRRRSPGYRIKNKNPTQRCGEKTCWFARAEEFEIVNILNRTKKTTVVIANIYIIFIIFYIHHMLIQLWSKLTNMCTFEVIEFWHMIASNFTPSNYPCKVPKQKGKIFVCLLGSRDGIVHSPQVDSLYL